MIGLALMMSVASGVIEISQYFLLGEVYNSFVSYERAKKLSSLVSIVNTTCTTEAVQQVLSNSSENSEQIFCDARIEGNVFNSASKFFCNPDDVLLSQISFLCTILAILGAVAFVMSFLSNAFMSFNSQRQSSHIRITFFQSLLQYNISWFETKDINSLGPLFVRYVLCIIIFKIR